MLYLAHAITQAGLSSLCTQDFHHREQSYPFLGKKIVSFPPERPLLIIDTIFPSALWIFSPSCSLGFWCKGLPNLASQWQTSDWKSWCPYSEVQQWTSFFIANTAVESKTSFFSHIRWRNPPTSSGMGDSSMFLLIVISLGAASYQHEWIVSKIWSETPAWYFICQTDLVAQHKHPWHGSVLRQGSKTLPTESWSAALSPAGKLSHVFSGKGSD